MVGKSCICGTIILCGHCIVSWLALFMIQLSVGGLGKAVKDDPSVWALCLVLILEEKRWVFTFKCAKLWVFSWFWGKISPTLLEVLFIMKKCISSSRKVYWSWSSSFVYEMAHRVDFDLCPSMRPTINYTSSWYFAEAVCMPVRQDIDM